MAVPTRLAITDEQLRLECDGRIRPGDGGSDSEMTIDQRNVRSSRRWTDQSGGASVRRKRRRREKMAEEAMLVVREAELVEESGSWRIEVDPRCGALRESLADDLDDGSVLPPVTQSPNSLRRRQRAVRLARASLGSTSPNPAEADRFGEGSLRSSSIPPQVASVLPPAGRGTERGNGGVALFGALGIAVGIALTALGAVLLGDNGGSGLTIKAVDSSGAALARSVIFVDGNRICESSTCRVDRLEPGNHLVRIQSGSTTTEQFVTVPKGESVHAVIALGPGAPPTVVAPASGAEAGFGREAILDIVRTALSAQSAGERRRTFASGVATPPVEAKDQPAPPTADQDDAIAGEATPTASSLPAWLASAGAPKDFAAAIASAAGGVGVAAASAKPGPRSGTAPPDGKGTIQITSSPAANVVVDGRATGTHQKVSVHVEPGIHVVAFVHPEFGRRVRTVRVEEGKAAGASVAFP